MTFTAHTLYTIHTMCVSVHKCVIVVYFYQKQQLTAKDEEEEEEKNDFENAKRRSRVPERNVCSGQGEKLHYYKI